MKKFLFIGLALGVAFMFAAPAMALDVDYSGFYRVRGFCVHDYEGFGKRIEVPDWYDTTNSIQYYHEESEHATDYFDMILGVEIVFNVHPRLKLITNFTALDKVWGETDADRPGHEAARGDDSNNIDWNQAYMEIDAGVGQFQVGRIRYGEFNHPFVDDGTEADGIRYTLNPSIWGGPRWNPLLFTFTYAKMFEGDWTNARSDEDIDEYRMTLGYVSDNFIIDSLIQFERDEFEFDISPATVISIDKADMWLYNLYAMMKFGIIKIEGEFAYTHGYITDPNYNDENLIPPNDWTGEMEDIEIDAMGWLIQTTLNIDRLEVYAGWAHTDGDKDGINDYYSPGNTINAFPGQVGDFDILFFLTGTESVIAENFGGMGNWSANGDNPHGLDLFYIGGGFDINRDVNISGVWGLARADRVPFGSKKIGWEADIWLTWQIMDGLQYKALFAFFDAGKFWEDAQNYYFDNPYDNPDAGNIMAYSHADDGSCWALMHQLTLSF